MEEFVAQAELDADDPALEVDEDMSMSSESAASQPEDMQYSRFFKDPNESEVSEEEPEKVFRTALDSQIDTLEEKLLSDKPWQLRGEINSKSRPVDSLLTEELDFQRASVAASLTHVPEVADELESVIKQRVLDMNYDDPQIKLPPSVPEPPLKPIFSSMKNRKRASRSYTKRITKKTFCTYQ